MAAPVFYLTDNGAVVCREHRHRVLERTSRLRPSEVEEQRTVLRHTLPSGVEIPLCLFCRQSLARP